VLTRTGVPEREQASGARGRGEADRICHISFYTDVYDRYYNALYRLVKVEHETFNKRLFAAVEINVALVMYFTTLWFVAPHAGEPWANAAFVAVMVFSGVYVLAVSPRIHRDTRGARGLGGWRSGFIRRDNLRGAIFHYGMATLVSAALMVLVVLWSDAAALSKVNRMAVWAKFVGYLPFTLVQDMFFYGFIFQRLLTLWPRPVQSEALPGSFGAAVRDGARHRLIIAGVMGVVFSACHVPNPPMMLLCFAAGVIWTSIFYATPNMLMLVVCHALLGTMISRVAFVYTRIGPFYANNDRYVFITVFGGIRELFAGLVAL
jgi:hypothetical protein